MTILPAKLGIVAGGGQLPKKLIEFCDQKNIQIFIIGFDGQSDPSIMANHDHVMTRLGAAGQIVRHLKERGIQDLVLIGSIKRPHLRELRPDLYTAAFFAKLGLRALGDDGLLSAIHGTLKQEGFTIHGIQDLMQDLLMVEGAVGKRAPDKAQWSDIQLGLSVAKTLGALDVGQSVVVYDGLVLGVEGVEGTDALIHRCASYRRAEKGGVLVKSCKPQQDRKLDMPTIGPETVRLCGELGYDGIAVEAGAALLVDRDEVRRMADENKIFVVGVKAE